MAITVSGYQEWEDDRGIDLSENDGQFVNRKAGDTQVHCKKKAQENFQNKWSTITPVPFKLSDHHVIC